MKRAELVNYLDNFLELRAFSGDVSNNGLQIEGGVEVRKAVFAVDGCQQTIDFAAKAEADFLFVHHGLSWGGGLKRWTGIDARRFAALFNNGISLYAAHLPLDAHAIHGNNAVLADMIDLQNRQSFFEYDGVDIGFSGTLAEPRSLGKIAGELGDILEVEPLLRGDENEIIRSCAIVSGGGGIDSVFAAASAGCRLLITGEMEHIMHHPAKELGVSIIALGHYASETTGILAMQKLISETFDVETLFAEVPTGL